MTVAQRQQIEADYTFKRIVELELNPVRGNFDTTHLKEINRRIFQDLPGADFDEVTPGEFRNPVPEGLDGMKQRGPSTVTGAFYVAYSRMDEAASSQLDKTLERVKPDALCSLKTSEFTEQLAKIYSELDYIHPFSDGNSRTFRTFTKQLAKESGYDLDWGWFGRSDVSRDLLYIARDLGVNELAKPHIQHVDALLKIQYTQDRYEGNMTLSELLRDAVQPSRAEAFERLSEREALNEYPELHEAYKTMHDAAAYFASKMPGKLNAQEVGIQSVMNRVLNCLNIGKTTDFN